MPPAELRTALKKAGRKPAACVIGLTKGRDAVILLDRLKKPRKLLAEAKAQAKAAGLDLDLPSLRFGRVSVSGKEAGFTVNKAVAPAAQQAMKAPMRAAGHPHFTVNADPAIEDEPDGPDEVDEDGDGTGGGVPGPVGASAGVPAGGGAVPATATSMAMAAPVPSGLSGGPAAPGPASGPPAGPGEVSRTADLTAARAPSTAALTGRLLPLVKQVSEAVKSGHPGSERLLAAAGAAHSALRSGDLAAAGRGADDLERLLGGPATAGARSESGMPGGGPSRNRMPGDGRGNAVQPPPAPAPGQRPSDGDAMLAGIARARAARDGVAGQGGSPLANAATGGVETERAADTPADTDPFRQALDSPALMPVRDGATAAGTELPADPAARETPDGLVRQARLNADAAMLGADRQRAERQAGGRPEGVQVAQLGGMVQGLGAMPPPVGAGRGSGLNAPLSTQQLGR